MIVALGLSKSSSTHIFIAVVIVSHLHVQLLSQSVIF